MNKNEQKAHKAVRRALKGDVSSLMHTSIVITDHVSTIRARDIIEDEIERWYRNEMNMSVKSMIKTERRFRTWNK